MVLRQSDGPMALLRSRDDDGWLLFENPVSVHDCIDPRDVPAMLETAEDERRAIGGGAEKAPAAGGTSGGGGESHPHGAAVYAVAYEAAAYFDEALETHAPGTGRPPKEPSAAGASGADAAGARPTPAGAPTGSTAPVAWCGVFAGWRFLSDAEARSEGEGADVKRPVLFGSWEPELSETEYRKAFRAVKELLEAGETYQINFTQRFRARLIERPQREQLLRLFLHLAGENRARYAAFVYTGDLGLLSVSPELFFEREGSCVRSRPMKGTIRRGASAAEDKALADALRGSEKERAENLMIVDMIRNDLGKRARVGSVAVPELFAIERYPGLHQMTSQVVAESDSSDAELLASLFPCASITGAPKVAAMRAIRRLEVSPRGFYTGTIGLSLPGNYSRWNVAIRTLSVDLVAGEAAYGTGGGIVWDSTEDSEYQEMVLKAGVLRHTDPGFQLLETMLVEPTGEVFLLDRHLARLGRSAKALGFVFPKGAIGRSIAAQAAAVPEGAESVILRLLLHKRGEFRIHATPLSQRPVPPTLTVRLATRPVDSNELFLRHKTTYRRVYEEALAEARDGSAEEVNDVLLFNERGELTEGTITNIVLQFGEKLFTPAAESGLLPGCYRESVLAAGRVTEAVLRVEDVHRCDAIWAVNSVRGMMPCRLTCQQAC